MRNAFEEGQAKRLRAERQRRWRGDNLKELHPQLVNERAKGQIHPLPQSVRYDKDRP
jgi:hypothetical protein